MRMPAGVTQLNPVMPNALRRTITDLGNNGYILSQQGARLTRRQGIRTSNESTEAG
jgi:hypothetical protein